MEERSQKAHFELIELASIVVIDSHIEKLESKKYTREDIGNILGTMKTLKNIVSTYGSNLCLGDIMEKTTKMLDLVDPGCIVETKSVET